MRSLAILLSLIAFGGLTACSGTNGDLESAQFHLDHGDYTQAITITEPIVAADSENFRAKTILASAKFGRGFLGEDTTYLGLFSKFLEGQAAGKSNMQTIQSITPAAAAAGKQDVYDAIDLIDSIPAADRTQENYLQLGFARLAVISVVGVVQVGGLESDDPCAYDFSAASDTDQDRFNEALDNVNDDFVNAGIEDFPTTGLGEQMTEIQTNLDAAASFQEYLANEYGATGC